jgi:hypothetical protein
MNWNKASKQTNDSINVTCAQVPVMCTKLATLALIGPQFTVNASLSRTVAQSNSHMSQLHTILEVL